MKIITEAIVNRGAAYNSVGGLITGTQRISEKHTIDYWQQANFSINLAIDINNLKDIKEIETAVYVGRIPTHFGHFLMEGLARLCYTCNFKFTDYWICNKRIFTRRD